MIVNNTFANNSGGDPTGPTGAIRIGSGNPTILNCVFWGNTETVGNTSASIYLDSGARMTIDYSDVQGGFNLVGGDTNQVVWGQNNLGADPLFANPGGSDYHLKSDAGRWTGSDWFNAPPGTYSPCIDAGQVYDPLVPDNPNADYTAEPQPNGARINMGAYGGTIEATKSP